MKKEMLYIILTLIATLGTMIYWPIQSNRDIEESIRKRTVKIQVFDDEAGAQGTGTKLGNGYIITNAHLFFPKLKPNYSITYRGYYDSIDFSAILISSNTKDDFAILRFGEKDNTNLLPVTTDWHLLEPIILLGNPQEGDFIVGHTRIVGYGKLRNPMGKIRSMFTYPCDTGGPGFSGSGIYNLKGEYLGTFEMGNSFNMLCYAIPAKEIIDQKLNTPWNIHGS